MNCAIYARKSNEQNGVADEAKSVARQMEHPRAYAVRKGWTVEEGHIYIDDGISGAVFAGRPGFVKVMNTLKENITPEDIEWSAEVRLAGLLAGLQVGPVWRPHRDSNPGFSLERAAS
jgi:hypothetical protein